MSGPLKLISHKLCPYVQRAVIALTEKGVPFERIDIDLAEQGDNAELLTPANVLGQRLVHRRLLGAVPARAQRLFEQVFVDSEIGCHV